MRTTHPATNLKLSFRPEMLEPRYHLLQYAWHAGEERVPWQREQLTICSALGLTKIRFLSEPATKREGRLCIPTACL